MENAHPINMAGNTHQNNERNPGLPIGPAIPLEDVVDEDA